jgi:Asp-tRNA(Asn)/Glu-tRNA(Gln) amidotransferase A subunit family amidase
MLHDLSIGELADRLAARELSSVELTRHFLARIERLNPGLNAVITVTAEAALALRPRRARPPARHPPHS